MLLLSPVMPSVLEAATYPAFALVAFLSWASSRAKVWARVRVPLWAMRFCGVLGRNALPAQQICATRNWFEMIGPHAMANAAEMIYFQAFGDWPDAELICETVGPDSVSSQPERSVTSRRAPASPGPAGLGKPHVRPEADSWGGRILGMLIGHGSMTSCADGLPLRSVGRLYSSTSGVVRHAG